MEHSENGKEGAVKINIFRFGLFTGGPLNGPSGLRAEWPVNSLVHWPGIAQERLCQPRTLKYRRAGVAFRLPELQMKGHPFECPFIWEGTVKIGISL